VALSPDTPTLEALREAAQGCRRCDLWRLGTQTVFGAGPSSAELMLVGEQPGDREDLEGEPFVGPAGGLLDGALDRAGIDRSTVYVTNAVKHFKWRPSAGGKRRLHDKPSWTEIGACRPWLEAEIAAVGPKLVVALGATAAQALLGKAFRVTRQRGTVHESPLGPVLATIHPSAVLRARDADSRRRELDGLVRDLRAAAAAAGAGAGLESGRAG
jgi:DNA polymerase